MNRFSDDPLLLLLAIPNSGQEVSFAPPVGNAAPFIGSIAIAAVVMLIAGYILRTKNVLARKMHRRRNWGTREFGLIELPSFSLFDVLLAFMQKP
jgi:hypothetical protein